MSNVLLVTVDSLRADRVADDTMPETAAFAADAAAFDDCVANGPSTPASFPSILASRQFGSVEGLGIPPAGTDSDVVTLAETLRAAGYATAGFTDNHFASGDYHFDRGFDTLHDASGATEAGRLKQYVQATLDDDGPVFRAIERLYTAADAVVSDATDTDEYERAASLNDRALSWIDEVDGDWFVWLHYMDPHHPYEPPPDYQETVCGETRSRSACRSLSRRATHYPAELTDEEWATVRALYDAECRYVDDQFAALLDGLAQRNCRTETTVVFTADHGELFDEHGQGGHPPEFWESTIRVPLAVESAAGVSIPAGSYDDQVRLLDVAPTLTDAHGIETPGDWQGQSLLPYLDEEGDPPTHSFGTIGRDVDYRRGYVRRADGWKYLVHETADHLFDVSETPAERPADDRYGEGVATESSLAAALSDHRDRMARLRRGERAVSEDDEMVEDHLKDLGYLE
jgi:arylsulfatase A-like enzyme